MKRVPASLVNSVPPGKGGLKVEARGARHSLTSRSPCGDRSGAALPPMILASPPTTEKPATDILGVPVAGF